MTWGRFSHSLSPQDTNLELSFKNTGVCVLHTFIGSRTHTRLRLVRFVLVRLQIHRHVGVMVTGLHVLNIRSSVSF